MQPTAISKALSKITLTIKINVSNAASECNLFYIKPNKGICRNTSKRQGGEEGQGAKKVSE